MSGTKQTSILYSKRRIAQQRLNPLLKSFKDAHLIAQDARLGASQRELERAIQDLRAELRRYSTSGDKRAKMFAALQAADATLSRIAVTFAQRPSSAEFVSLSSEIDAFLQGKLFGDVESTRSRMIQIIERAVRAESMRGEAEPAVKTINRILSTADRATASTDAHAQAVISLHESLAAAAKQTVDAESEAQSKFDPEDARLGELDSVSHSHEISVAHDCIAAGDLEGSSNHVEKARAIRVEAQTKAAEIHQQIEMREELAAHLAKTLEQRNYDPCQAYYLEGPGGDERPRVIYANNPSGTAHVRLTLWLDGRMTVEVDGVPQGQEEICVDILEAFRKTVEDNGDEFVVRDPGLASKFITRLMPKTREQERQREHE